MKRLKRFLLVILACILPVLVNAAPTVFPHGVTIYKPDKCWNGYTLIATINAVRPGEKAVPLGVPIIDMNGNVVHEWKNAVGFPPKLLPGGHLLAGLIKPGRTGIEVNTIAQFDFNGNIEWQWDKAEEVQVKGPDGKLEKIWVAGQHHDVQREPNPVGYYAPGQDAYVDKGRTLILGREPSSLIIGKQYTYTDAHERMMEVDWQGNVVWDYRGSAHKDDGVSRPEWMGQKGPWGANSMSWLGRNKWYEAGDERFHPDNIILDNLADVIFIISKKTSKVTWQVGPDFSKYPQLAKLGIKRDEFNGLTGGYQGGMMHHAHMIPKGLPGEGNILVFKNGSPYSIVMEFNPVTLEVVWEYGGPALGYGESHGLAHYFSSPAISSVQRLPNGNTMICEGDGGRIFEVTKELETVWEYIYPVYHWEGLGGVLRDYKQPKRVAKANSVYRAYRYPYSYVPQLKKPVERSVTPPKLEDWRLPVDK